MKCQAIIEDFENGERYNLVRVIVDPERRPCRFDAKRRLGKLCLCTIHTRMAREGCIDINGQVAPKSDIAATRRAGASALFTWAVNLKPEAL